MTSKRKINGKEISGGFFTPTIGERHPKGTKVKKNKDGTITLIEPKGSCKK